ncbi:MAG TPA: FAD-dependent oxidoreductase [Salinisphaeraceae bacterium]|nr:FAD-dependent oxidoreductase [Salinisphaeraceae bacterium]
MSYWSVIGSGVTGLCVATELQARGASLEVIVDAQKPAASALAGGMLAPWCEAESAPQEVSVAGAAALAWWAAHVSGVERQGSLVLAPARDSAELTRFARLTRGHQWVEPGALEADLAGRFARGLYFPEEGHLDPRRALAELQARLIEQNVPFHEGAPVGRVIDCRGMAAADQLSDLRAVRGEMVILQTREVALARPLRLLHPRFPCYLVPRGEGRFMLGATMVESHDDSPISARALMELLGSAYAIHPAFAEARILETGTGLRPAFADNMPAIRRQNDIIYVNGMYRHGFLLAPIMAQRLMQQLEQEL